MTVTSEYLFGGQRSRLLSCLLFPEESSIATGVSVEASVGIEDIRDIIADFDAALNIAFSQ